jgi:hypothetical protein
MENVKKFYEALSKDEAMKSRAEALNTKYKGAIPDESAVTAEIATFAKSEGYDFSIEELIAYNRGSAKEIPDDALLAVAGGAYQPYRCVCAIGGGGMGSEGGPFCSCVINGMGEDWVWECKELPKG